MLDMNVTRQDEVVEVLEKATDPTMEASSSFVTSRGDATFGSADKADAMREAGALCGIGTVAAPSRERRKVPDRASEMLISCCSRMPLALSHSCCAENRHRAKTFKCPGSHLSSLP